MSEVSELVRFQRELKEEEQLIISMLSKIDAQLHALQVEQLQLLNATNTPRQSLSSVNPETTMEIDVKKELDLDVRHVWQESEDDEED